MTARKTRQYVAAAAESLTLAVELFNRPSLTGREHATVMMTAYDFEMLLKAAIFEQRGKTKFSGSDRSFDLGQVCVGRRDIVGCHRRGDRVVLLALKEDRDAVTHDVITMSEDVLWLHLRSAVTIFRKVLLGLTGQDLTDVMLGPVFPALNAWMGEAFDRKDHDRTVAALLADQHRQAGDTSVHQGIKKPLADAGKRVRRPRKAVEAGAYPEALVDSTTRVRASSCANSCRCRRQAEADLGASTST